MDVATDIFFCTVTYHIQVIRIIKKERNIGGDLVQCIKCWRDFDMGIALKMNVIFQSIVEGQNEKWKGLKCCITLEKSL